MCFFTVKLLPRCSLINATMYKSYGASVYKLLHLLQVTWYTVFLCRHRLVFEKRQIVHVFWVWWRRFCKWQILGGLLCWRFWKICNLVDLRWMGFLSTVECRFNEVTGDRPNLFVKWRVCYIENLDKTNLRRNDQKVRYIEVIVNDWFVTQVTQFCGNTIVPMSTTCKPLTERLLSLYHKD